MRKIKEFKETASELIAKVYEAGYRAGYQAKRREEASPIEDDENDTQQSLRFK